MDSNLLFVFRIGGQPQDSNKDVQRATSVAKHMRLPLQAPPRQPGAGLTRTDRKHLEFALRRALFVAAEAHNERRIAIGGQALEDTT